LEVLINVPYSPRSPGGFLKYLDTLQAHLNELETLLPGTYPDTQKRRLLFRNLCEVPSLHYLIRNCKDQDFTYQESVLYLRMACGSVDIPTNPRKIQTAAVEDSSLTLEEARATFHIMADESSHAHAYQVLKQSPTVRTSLRIPPAIWHKLSKEIQAEIQAIRAQLQDAPDKPKLETPQSNPQQLPPQYGLSRNAKTTTSEDVERLTNAIQSYHLADDDDITISDEDEDIRMGGW
jgi:hypothetical protein